MPKKKKNVKLPKSLMYIKNKEKGFHESWTPGRGMLNIVHPFRALFLGGVNSGKTNTIKNLVAHQQPPFEKIYLLHVGGNFTSEYDEIEVEILTEIPRVEDERFDGKEKSLIIVEDKSFDNLVRVEKKALNRLFGYMSTHRNISITLTSQNFMDVPTCVRRMSNLFVIWKVSDTDLLKTIGRRVGVSKECILSLSKKYYVHHRDSIWFDRTSGSPYPYRKNGFELIKLDEEGAECKKSKRKSKAKEQQPVSDVSSEEDLFEDSI
jgi:hypothetical protein